MSRTVSAEAMRDLLDGASNQVTKAFQEIEQLQADFQGAYTRFKADHDKALSALVAQIEAMPADSLGKTLHRQIDARLPAEREIIADRVAQLEKEDIPGMQRQADDLVSKGQKEEGDLREINPRLNEREEALKGELTAGQRQLDNLNAQVNASSRGLGFVFHARSIHDLDRQRFRVVGKMEALDQELVKVRKEWHDLRGLANKNETDWQTLWQLKMAQLGELRQEHDHLVQNADALARHRAVFFVVDNLKDPAIGAPPGLDAALRPMIDLNVQTDDYQAALGSVASILGIAKGVNEGLTRLRESVKALVDEQTRNSAFLPPLKINLPDDVLSFGAVWDDLAVKAKDEKALAQHPMDFVGACKPFLDERLTKGLIAAFFDDLGQALTRATVGWKGS
ncbi:MAG: hypothetical protein M1482_02095 [Chloroflexi bacterium]|nr:hypothetical protein [Chloroflexota bacterium]